MSGPSINIPLLHASFIEGQIPDVWMAEAEKDAAASFSDKRKREFATGRHCARQALTYLGMPEAPIPVGPHRNPVWPIGVIGSISHTDTLTGAMVAKSTEYRSIGLDIEREQALSEELLDLILTPGEQSRVLGDLAMATLIFSLKEAFYKMQFPLTGLFLDFKEVETDPSLSSIRILKPFPDTGKHVLGHHSWNAHLITWALAI